MHNNEVIVSIGQDRYRTEVRAGENGRHVIVADEPEALGGTDTGATPYELLLGAVGACKAVTLRMYADRKGWPLEGVVCTLRHERRHPDDCVDCESESSKIGFIDVDLQVLGDSLTDEQRARLVEIADKCPVHKTITTDLRVVTRAVTEDA